MADIRLPSIVRRALGVLATEDDSTMLDTVLSVGATVLVAQLVAPLITSLVPATAFIAVPLTAGIVAALVNHLS